MRTEKLKQLEVEQDLHISCRTTFSITILSPYFTGALVSAAVIRFASHCFFALLSSPSVWPQEFYRGSGVFQNTFFCFVVPSY